MENLEEMKQWLKENGKALRALKMDMRSAMRNGEYNKIWTFQCDIELAKSIYRHKHIAYSMARGKTYEQVESYTRERTHRLDWNWINEMIEAIKPKEDLS